MYLKKGAMFGLDARIALAIFGALSVISGAALYSAIQQSKVVAIVADANELGKATEEYMLNVGEDIPFRANNFDGDMAAAYLSSSKAGWSGPYLPYSDPGDSRGMLKHSLYKLVTVQKYTDEDFTGTCNPVVCAAGKACFYWNVIWEVPLGLADAVDSSYDDGDRAKGNIRVSYSCGHAAGAAAVAFKGPLLLNQP
tara:strand:- start:118 stop:705 length:588 start_codon:yes stop_codon:yes gene_type:complete